MPKRLIVSEQAGAVQVLLQRDFIPEPCGGPVPIQAPFSDQEREDLRWYLEDYHEFPHEPVVSISEADSTQPPPPVPMPRSAMAESVPLAPGEQSVGFSVTVVWELT